MPKIPLPIRRRAAALLASSLFIAAPLSAAPVAFDFSITASEGGVLGSFAGEDFDNDARLSRNELSSFSVLATGTAFTGGPIEISASEAVLDEFGFSLTTYGLFFQATNGGTEGTSGFEEVYCAPLSCGAGNTLFVSRDNRLSSRPITELVVTPAALPPLSVPEPGTLGLALAAGAAFAFGARRSRQADRGRTLTRIARAP